MLREDAISVDMAEIKVAKAPQQFVTFGLGSCIAVCVYDALAQVGGVAHVLLPTSPASREITTPGKFGDTAVPELLKQIEELGAIHSRLQIVIVGGANMFSFDTKKTIFDIGKRNIKAVETACALAGVPIVSRFVGGDCGRRMEFDLDTGLVNVCTIERLK